jgi:hypothetical protein
MSLYRLLLPSILLGGCITSSPPARTNLTATQHESEARRAEQIAAEHERRRDPDLYSVQRCGVFGTPAFQGPAGAPVPGFNASVSQISAPSSPCGTWLDEKRDHEREVQRQRQIAAEHRAAAARMRSVEARACNDVPTEELWARPTPTGGDVLAVRALPDYGRTGKASSQRGGATVLVREQPGMTPRKLERVLRCDAARALVYGDEQTPWAVPGSKAAVVETDAGLLVEITSDDRETARKIEERAARLSRGSDATR